MSRRRFTESSRYDLETGSPERVRRARALFEQLFAYQVAFDASLRAAVGIRR